MSLTGAYAILGRLPEVFREQFELLETLGQGATSLAVKARRHDDGREVVIKVLLCDDAESRARFLIEAKALAEVDHPNVVHLSSSGESEDLLYMVLEFLPGMTLQQRMKSSQIGAAGVKILAIGIAAGLEAIHAKDILHRDVKPANIWCLEDGSPKLLDFGLARQGSGAGVTQIGSRLGTPGYASPEQIRGEPVGPATDVYSMGLILYEVVTGAQPSERRPGDSNSIRIRLEKEKDSPLLASIPTSFTELVGEMLAADPAARPDAGKVRTRLETLDWTQTSAAMPRGTSGGRPRDSGPIVPPKPSRSRSGRRATLVPWMLLAVSAGMALTAAIVRLRRPSPPAVTLESPGDPASPTPTEDPLVSFRELHGRLYAGIATDKLDGRYWIHLLVNLSRASRVPYRSLNELIDTLERGGKVPPAEIRKTLELLATGARKALAEIAPRVPAQLEAPGSAISRSDRWMVFECLVPFLLLDRTLSVQGLADLRIGTDALLEKSDLTGFPVIDSRPGWKQLRHYLHRTGGKGSGFENIDLANAGFMPEERGADQLDPLTRTAITQDRFAASLETEITRHDLSPGGASPGPVALQLVSWTIMGTPAAFSEQDIVWISFAGHRPVPVHTGLAQSFEYAGVIDALKKPVVFTLSLPRRLIEPGVPCPLRAWREVIDSAVSPFAAQTDLFIGWGRLVEL